MRTTGLWMVLALAAWACDDGDGGAADTGVVTDGGTDGPAASDAAPDQSRPDAAADQAVPDAARDQAVPDAAADQSLPDAAADQAVPDAAPPDADLPDVPSVEPGCALDRDCAPDLRCDACARSSCPECDDCIADCAPHGCPSEPQPACDEARPECGGGNFAVVQNGCWQCVNAQCQPLDGRDNSCDDGSVPVCEIEPPQCGEFEILAHQGGCFQCVNPATCRPWGQPGCEADDDCPAGQVCDDCGTSSCPFCEDCVPACREPRQ